MQSRVHQKGTEEIAEKNLSLLVCFLAAISSVPLPAATLQVSGSCRGADLLFKTGL